MNLGCGCSQYEQAAQLAEADGQHAVAAQLRGLGRSTGPTRGTRMPGRPVDYAMRRGVGRLGGLGSLGAVAYTVTPDTVDGVTMYMIQGDDGSYAYLSDSAYNQWQADQASGSSASWFTAENIQLLLKFGITIEQLIANPTAYGAKAGVVVKPPATTGIPTWGWVAIAAAGALGVGYLLLK